jgi:hypothetical protein
VGKGAGMENEQARLGEALGVLKEASADAAQLASCPIAPWFLLNLLD